MITRKARTSVRRQLAPDGQLVRRLSADVTAVKARAWTARHDDLSNLCSAHVRVVPPAAKEAAVATRCGQGLRSAGFAADLETLTSLDHVQRSPASQGRQHTFSFEVSSVRTQRRVDRSSTALANPTTRTTSCGRFGAGRCSASRAAASASHAQEKQECSRGGIDPRARTCSSRHNTPCARSKGQPARRYATRSPRPARRCQAAAPGSIKAPSQHAPRTPSARLPASSGCPADTPRAHPAARRAAWAQCRRRRRAWRRAPPASQPAFAQRSRSRR